MSYVLRPKHRGAYLLYSHSVGEKMGKRSHLAAGRSKKCVLAEQSCAQFYISLSIYLSLSTYPSIYPPLPLSLFLSLSVYKSLPRFDFQ